MRKCGETLNNAIKVQDQLFARIRELEESLKNCADDLASEVNHRWKMNDGRIHPANLKKYNADMVPVLHARALLNEKNPADQ